MQLDAKHVRTDLEVGLQNLQTLLKVGGRVENLPVAFASNAMYVLARNGLASTAEFHQIAHEQLLPLLMQKQANLHGEGISMAAYALNEAGIYDAAVWEMLVERAAQHNFDYEVLVGNGKHVGGFKRMGLQKGHFGLGNILYYQDKLNLFELYNAVSAASTHLPQLSAARDSMKAKYSTLSRNAEYLQITGAAAQL